MEKALTGPKRNRHQLEHDRHRISKLLVDGYHAHEIAEMINDGRPEHEQVSVQSIENDIRVIHNRWQESTLNNYNFWQNKLLAELENVKRDYRTEFEKSKQNKITTAIEALADDEGVDEIRGNGGLIGELSQVKRVQTKEEMREGNVAYLNGIQAVIAQQCRMLGIDAPHKLALTDPSGQNEAGGTVEYLKSLFDKMQENADNPLELNPGEPGTEEKTDE